VAKQAPQQAARRSARPPLEEDVGPRLRAYREQRGLSLRELARRLGVSPSAISQIETGKSRPSVSTLYSIVSAFWAPSFSLAVSTATRLIQGLILMLVAWSAVRTPRHLWWIVTAFVVGALLTSVLSGSPTADAGNRLEGDFGVFANHAPTVSLLRPGILIVYAGGAQTRYVVMGGFVEVSAKGDVTILADTAATMEEFDRDALHQQITELEGKIKDMPQDSILDREIQRLDHFKQVDAHLQGTAMH